MCNVLIVIHCKPKYVSILYCYRPIVTFSIEYWRNLEIWVKDRSTSLKMAPIDKNYYTTNSIWSAIVNTSLSVTIFELLNGEEHRDLENYVRGHSRSLKMVYDSFSAVSCRIPQQLQPYGPTFSRFDTIHEHFLDKDTQPYRHTLRQQKPRLCIASRGKTYSTQQDLE